MEVSVLKTFRDGVIGGQILSFGDEFENGFALWRWTHFPKASSQSTNRYRREDAARLRSMIELIDETMKAAAFDHVSGTKIRTMKPPVPLDVRPNALHVGSFGDIRLLITTTPKGGQRFQFWRITDDEPPFAATWFLGEHVPLLLAATDAAEEWLRMNFPRESDLAA